MGMSPKDQHYTLVQHSGYTAGGNPQFSLAVQTHYISEKLVKAVEKAGGLVFDTYARACEAEMLVNYPYKEYTGLIPSVRGSFRLVRSVSHLIPLYIPTVDEAEQFGKVDA